MNIRNKFLISKDYAFEEINVRWHENPVFKLKNNLLEHKIFLGLTRDPLIFLNDLKLKESELKPDYLIFASRHTSKTTRPSFLVHTTGNWSKDPNFGGEPRELSRASALLHKAGFLSLIEQEFPNTLTNFSLDIEITHHGPTKLEKPLVFMELGSSKTEWKIEEAGELLANTIIKAINKFVKLKRDSNQEIGLGFGGTHYAPNYRRVIINSNIALSFICPKYHIQELDKEIIRKMINNTSEQVDYFIIDWKGTNSEDKKHLIPLLEEFEIPIKKTKDFKL
ncbi:MAG: D-aminoacyl-tRNA deacylase [Promethearchaeota archaeon]|nr:MAG: D-aminoacyl-tRNA deacylase [Candidatus Lokiarchaeota archaeon]